jgi:hypothetical protein
MMTLIVVMIVSVVRVGMMLMAPANLRPFLLLPPAVFVLVQLS